MKLLVNNTNANTLVWDTRPAQQLDFKVYTSYRRRQCGCNHKEGECHAKAKLSICYEDMLSLKVDGFYSTLIVCWMSKKQTFTDPRNVHVGRNLQCLIWSPYFDVQNLSNCSFVPYMD